MSLSLTFLLCEMKTAALPEAGGQGCPLCLAPLAGESCGKGLLWGWESRKAWLASVPALSPGFPIVTELFSVSVGRFFCLFVLQLLGVCETVLGQRPRLT